MNNSEVHTQLNEWLVDLLGITMIKDRQQVDRPAPTYGMTDLVNFRPLHDHVDNISYEGDVDVTVTPEYEIEWMFLCFFYGAQGENLARRLHSAVRLTQLQEPLRPDLIVHEVSMANSIPELVGEKWEPRTQVNIVVRGKSSDSFATEVIEEHDFNFTGERA